MLLSVLFHRLGFSICIFKLAKQTLNIDPFRSSLFASKCLPPVAVYYTCNLKLILSEDPSEVVWSFSYVLPSSSSSSISILKKYISNVSRPIVIKQHWYNGKGYTDFMSDCIGHMVAMSTQSFYRLMIGYL